MTSKDRPRLRPGHPPWEPFNGIRIGGLAGVLLGGAVTAIASISNPWVIVGGAVVGSAVGYWVTRARSP